MTLSRFAKTFRTCRLIFSELPVFFFPELFRSFAAEAGTGLSFVTAACSGTASGRYERLPTMALNLYRDRRQVKITLKIPVHFFEGQAV